MERRRFALNRITCPSLSLEDFFRLASELGLSKVELRNDLPGGKVTDGLSASKTAALAQANSAPQQVLSLLKQ